MKLVKFDHSLSRTLFGMQQKCDLSYIFGVYKVKKVKFDHSPFRTLRDTQQKLDIHRTFF